MYMFKPKNSSMSPRFVGPRTFMRLPFENTLDNLDFLIMGVPFDTGASNRTGQRYGPQSIRDFSVLLRPYNLDQEINIFDYCSGIDYGDVDVIPGNVLKTYDKITEKLEPILNREIVPILLGGDHSITLGHLRAFAKKYGPISLIHFDAHSDTWDDYFWEKYVHGTPFRRAVEEGLVDTSKSIQIGIRGPLYGPEDVKNAKDLGYQVVTMREVRDLGIENVAKVIRKRVGDNPVFISFDIDFLDPAYAPGTGTPEVGGPTSFEALEYVRRLKGLNIKGFDLVEVLPTYDANEITSMAAASIIFEMITLIALNKRSNL
ncbi:agmatinase [Staphylococcus gallinarum]|nr:agmatinase [Staphylococcus gallinarum]